MPDEITEWMINTEADLVVHLALFLTQRPQHQLRVKLKHLHIECASKMKVLMPALDKYDQAIVAAVIKWRKKPSQIFFMAQVRVC